MMHAAVLGQPSCFTEATGVAIQQPIGSPTQVHAESARLPHITIDVTVWATVRQLEHTLLSGLCLVASVSTAHRRKTKAVHGSHATTANG